MSISIPDINNTRAPENYRRFQNDVLSGKIAVNENIQMQMQLIDHLIASPDYYFSQSVVDGFIAYSETEMCLTDGDDLVLTPAFKLWAEDLLGWYYYVEETIYNPVTNREEQQVALKRLRNKQFLIVQRSNAKTLYASLIQSYFLIIDPSTTTQIVVAPTMRQTEETTSLIATAITRSRGPVFKYMTQGNVKSNNQTKAKLASTKKGIENLLTNSIIESRPMEIHKLQGLRSKVNTIDEWLSGKIKENPIGALEQGAAKIDDYIILATSSEGLVRGGIGDTIKLELQQILRGEIYDPHTSIWHYCLDNISEVSNPRLWVKANPNIGITVSYDTIMKDVRRAENVPTERNDIVAKRFGIPLEGHTYFFKYEETLPHIEQDFNGMVCSMGVDLSQGDDFCAFTFLFPLGGDRFGVKTRSYVCQSKVDKLDKATRELYETFILEGSLIVKNQIYLDMRDVYLDLQDHIYSHNYGISAVGYDPYQAEKFMNYWCEVNSEYGVVVVRQGYRTESVPLGEIRNLAEARLLLFDEKLMKFSMENSIAMQDTNGNLKLSKKRAKDKIDNVAALMDAWIAYKQNLEVFE